MKNKVDRRDLSELRNEVDLISIRLDEMDKCDPGTIGQMHGLPHFRTNRKLFFERNKLTEWILNRIK